MMTRCLTFTACLLAIATAACQPPAQEAAPLSEAEIATIKDLAENQVVEVLMAEDWAAFAAGFTEDAVRMPPNEPLHVGREAIESWAATNWGPITTTEFSQTVLDVDGRGDLAYARGSYSATVEVPGVPEPISDVGKFLAILRKQPDGSWLVSHAIFNADAPLPPMGPEQ